MKHVFVIPFRDRGLDPLRRANLEHVTAYLLHLGLGNIIIVSDGREGDAPFSRSAAYNRGAKIAYADGNTANIITFYESDMLVPKPQLEQAITLAAAKPGLVIPFTTYHYLDAASSARVRDGDLKAEICVPESFLDNGRAVGAVNVLSWESLHLVGQWDETFEGSWYDDRAMARAFEVCCGPTRYVDGVGRHLYHVPGWKGEHLSDEDKRATRRNKARFDLYKQAQTSWDIRKLTKGEA